MSSPARQRTLAGAIELSGVGIHTGERCSIRVVAAGIGEGIRLRRADLAGSPLIGLDETPDETAPGRTTLGSAGATVQTVEHLLGALWGMGVDNAVAEVDGPEVPAMDGSALPFASAVAAAGLDEQDADRSVLVVSEPLSFEDGPASISAAPGDGFLLSYRLHYDSSALAQGTASFTLDPGIFLKEIAPARTFCMESDIEALRSAGLGKGADASNTLVIAGDGVIDNELRFPDEPVRHKLLDMVGDLALAGTRIRGRIAGARSGHALNRRMAAALRAGGGGLS